MDTLSGPTVTIDRAHFETILRRWVPDSCTLARPSRSQPCLQIFSLLLSETRGLFNGIGLGILACFRRKQGSKPSCTVPHYDILTSIHIDLSRS